MSQYTDLQERARRVVEAGAALVETKLFGLQARHQAFPAGEGEILLSDLALRLENSATAETMLAYVLVLQTQVLQVTDGEDEPAVLADLEVAYGARYVLSDGVGELSSDEVRAFGFSIAAMALWPYIRATVSHTIAEMNLAFSALIPTITQAELAAAAGAEAEDLASPGSLPPA